MKIHAVLSLYTGILHGEFADMHEYAEQLLGRPIFTHEFASKELNETFKQLSKPDFLKVIQQIKDIELQ